MLSISHWGLFPSGVFTDPEAVYFAEFTHGEWYWITGRGLFRALGKSDANP